MVEKLDDTTLLTGSEAYSAALVFYNALKGAAKAGEPGMKTVYADLQSRYPGRGQVVPAPCCSQEEAGGDLRLCSPLLSHAS